MASDRDPQAPARGWSEQELGLIDDIQLWWSMRLDLWAELRSLLTAEARLAAKSSAQLLAGLCGILILCALTLLFLELLLIALLVSIDAPIAVALLVVVFLNIVLASTIYRVIRDLPNNLSFKHTRRAMSSSQESDATSADKSVE